MDAGLDSLGAVELRNALERSVGASLPATVVFDYPTVQALVGFIHALLAPCSLTALATPLVADSGFVPFVVLSAFVKEDSAIDSRSGGGASRTAPYCRWDGDFLTGTDLTVNLGGWLLSDVSMFDAYLFGINRNEAAVMDPQQRMLLEAVARTLSLATCVGETPLSVEEHVGIAVGVQHAEYAQLAGSVHASPNSYVATGGALSVIAGRIAYSYGLRGPAVCLDTACSASLVAVHTACRWIDDRCSPVQAALGGGVGLLLAPGTSLQICRAGMLSVEGRCKTFDASADGYARAESVGAVLLRSGNCCAGIPVLVRSSAVNQDGRSSSLTAPNGRAQASAIALSLGAACVRAGDVCLLEAHGTGTPLGDPIELNAAQTVLGASRDAPLVFAAVKSSTGHAESGAGISGLLDAVTALASRSSRPLGHIRCLNPFLSVEHGTVFPRQPMGAASTLLDVLAGVSSFAFQGTNAHATVQTLSAAGHAARSHLLLEGTRAWFAPPHLRLNGVFSSKSSLEMASFSLTADAMRDKLPQGCLVRGGRSLMMHSTLIELALAALSPLGAAPPHAFSRVWRES
jgi:acyl transferase domain-containing protein